MRKALVLVSLVAALAGIGSQSAHAGVFTVEGVVVNQQCIGGDFVRVTLTATATDPALFAWDFTNNGSFDTGLRANPTVSRLYPDETNITARVGAVNEARQTDTDLVTFATLRCP